MTSTGQNAGVQTYSRTVLELASDFVGGPLPYVGLRQVAVWR